MVFLIQNTQNRDTKAVHLKLDELLCAQIGAREREFMALEDQDEEQLKAERKKLFAECGVCTSSEEHAQHGSAGLAGAAPLGSLTTLVIFRGLH